MADTINIFTGSKGLNTEVDPVRLPFDPKTGVQYLGAAYNIDHDSTGRVSRRKGFASTARTEDIHSIFCDDGACLFVIGTSLCELHSDFSYSILASVTGGARVSYLQLHNRVYWSNGIEKGYVENGANNDWVKGTYYGPATTRQLSDPPAGTHLAFFGGSIFIIQGNVAWYTEPFNLNAVDLARNYYQFQTNIRMWRAVTGGVFVSTERNTYFLPGNTANALSRIRKANYPVIEGTDAAMPLDILPDLGGTTDMGAIWTSEQGICMGMPDGQIMNLTKSKITYPKALRGAGIVLHKRYIATLEP